MNDRFEDRPRSSWDVVQFAITFFGLLITGAGIVSTSLALAVIGILLVVWGFGYFVLKQW
jgi:hypothetical protein